MTKWLISLFIKNHEDVKNQQVRAAYGTLGSAVGILVNVLLSVLKFVIGLVTGSVAITADAANNLSDAGSSVVSLFSVRMAQKSGDKEHPFGHGRMEYVGALIVGVLILMMGAELFKSGVEGILSPAPLTLSAVTVVLLVVSILLKAWLYFFYKKVGGTIDSATLLAASKDSISDVIATSAVVVSMLAAHFFSLPLDGYMGLVVALIVLKAGFSVCKDTVDLLLGGKPDPEVEKALEKKLTSYEGILGIHDMVIHDYGPGRCFVSVHAEVSAKDNILVAHELIDKMEREIAKEMHFPICIHMDPIVTDDPLANEICAKMKDFLITVDSRLKLHDFRMVPGQNQTNLIFDVLEPVDYQEEDALEQKIRAYARELSSTYVCVLQFDRDYY